MVQSDWMVGTHYAEISLGNTLSGEVHVWTQTPEFYKHMSHLMQY